MNERLQEDSKPQGREGERIIEGAGGRKSGGKERAQGKGGLKEGELQDKMRNETFGRASATRKRFGQESFKMQG